MDNIIDIEEIQLPEPTATSTDRLRYLIKLSRLTQASFAKKAGVDPAYLSRILTGKHNLRESLINRLVVNLGVSKEWLISGKDIPFPKNVLAEETDSVGAPVYDIDVTAGHAPLSRMFTDEHVVGRCYLPGVNPNWPLVRVSGDSMTPRICSGAYISIRPVSLESPIYWGRVYVVVLEDYRLVKVIRRHEDPSLVILHSINPEYDDMEVRRDQIIGLYMVETILNYEAVC